MTGVEGAAMSRASIGCASKASRPAWMASAKASAIAAGIAGLGDGRVEQDAVIAQLHRLRRMGGQADAGVDDERNIREMLAHACAARRGC